MMYKILKYCCIFVVYFLLCKGHFISVGIERPNEITGRKLYENTEMYTVNLPPWALVTINTYKGKDSQVWVRADRLPNDIKFGDECWVYLTHDKFGDYWIEIKAKELVRGVK